MISTDVKEFSVTMIEDRPSDVKSFRRVMSEIPVDTDITGIRTVEAGIRAMVNTVESRRECPDLIVLDLDLPAFNGFNVLSYFERNFRLRSVPVIIFTASRKQENILKAWQLGAQSYVIKPDNRNGWQRFVDIIYTFWKDDDLKKLPFFF